MFSLPFGCQKFGPPCSSFGACLWPCAVVVPRLSSLVFCLFSLVSSLPCLSSTHPSLSPLLSPPSSFPFSLTSRPPPLLSRLSSLLSPAAAAAAAPAHAIPRLRQSSSALQHSVATGGKISAMGGVRSQQGGKSQQSTILISAGIWSLLLGFGPKSGTPNLGFGVQIPDFSTRKSGSYRV